MTGRPDAPPATVLVLAKAPCPGRSKTRLAPVFGRDGAARLAAAALQDSLDAVAASAVPRRALVLDGDLRTSPRPVRVPPGFAVVPQVPGDHATRIAAALAACRGPAVLVGMDTPQLTPALLDRAVAAVSGAPASGALACLGAAEDGGWWALGLSAPGRHARAALAGVPMSTSVTGARQRARLARLGLAVTDLPALRDVDTPDDALVVAGAAPWTGFARAVRELLPAGAAALPVPGA